MSLGDRASQSHAEAEPKAECVSLGGTAKQSPVYSSVSRAPTHPTDRPTRAGPAAQAGSVATNQRKKGTPPAGRHAVRCRATLPSNLPCHAIGRCARVAPLVTLCYSLPRLLLTAKVWGKSPEVRGRQTGRRRGGGQGGRQAGKGRGETDPTLDVREAGRRGVRQAESQGVRDVPRTGRRRRWGRVRSRVLSALLPKHAPALPTYPASPACPPPDITFSHPHTVMSHTRSHACFILKIPTGWQHAGEHGLAFHAREGWHAPRASFVRINRNQQAPTWVISSV